MISLDNHKLRIKSIIYKCGLMVFKDPNVIAVGRGNKIINGHMSNYPTLTIIVKKKISSNLIHPSLGIPKTIMGVATDVLEKSDLVVEESPKSKFVEDLGLDDGPPAIGGGCIICGNKLGTLAHPVTERGRKQNIYFLGSGSVLAEPDTSIRRGKVVMYAKNSIPSNLGKAWKLGTVERGIPAKLSKVSTEDDTYEVMILNRTDAVLGLIGPNNAKTKEIVLGGLINGKLVAGIQKNTDIKIGAKVFKYGMKTANSEGAIMMLDALEKVNVDDKNLKYYSEQIIVKMNGAGGDEGALGVMQDTSRAFGIMNANNQGLVVFSDINTVFNDLDIELFIN